MLISDFSFTLSNVNFSGIFYQMIDSEMYLQVLLYFRFSFPTLPHRRMSRQKPSRVWSTLEKIQFDLSGNIIFLSNNSIDYPEMSYNCT